MPRYLHIPHTPDTAQTLTLSGRTCLAVSGMPPPLQGTQKSHSGAATPERYLHPQRPASRIGCVAFQLYNNECVTLKQIRQWTDKKNKRHKGIKGDRSVPM